VDDGSTDQSHLVIQKYLTDKRVHLLHQDNKGVSAARNLGIKTSQAEWICFIDSDDEWLPHKLEKQIEFSKKNNHFRFIHSNEIWIRNGIRVNAPKKFNKKSEDIFRRSLELCLISPSTVMMKRELCELHDFFNEEFVVCEDYDLWLKILANEDIGFMDDYLIKKYGGHNDQLSKKFPAMDFWRIKSMVQLLKNKTSLQEEKKVFLKEEISKKASILLQGYLRHQNQKAHQELLELLKLIK
jgi:glycosyltransferase involved in cell wall biosynthesis